MQGKSSSGSLLLKLSSDVLSATLRLVSVQELNRLYRAGDRRAWRAIALSNKEFAFHFRTTVIPPSALAWIAQFSNLKSLTLGISLAGAQSAVTPDFFSSLSQKLETLSITLGQPSAKAFRAIPRSLKTLQFNNNRSIPHHFMHELPPNLTCLSIPEVKVSKEFIENLPQTLESLTLGDRAWTASLLELLPPDLTELRLPQDAFLESNDIKKLPSSLMTLYLPSNCLLNDEAAPHLPRSLTCLEIGQTRLTPRALPNLPTEILRAIYPPSLIANLTDADIRFLNPKMSYINLRGASELTRKCRDHLPAAMLRWKMHSSLPDGLATEAAIDYVKWLGLPPHERYDTEFPSNNAPGFSSSTDYPLTTAVFPQWVTVRLNDQFIPHLPRTITTINWPEVYLSDDSCSDMPPTLTALVLPKTSNIGDLGLSRLPRGLITLLIPKCFLVTDTGLGLLPPTLQRLNLDMNRNITDTGLAFLPSTLLELNLKTADIADDGIKALPRGLLTLDLGWTKKVTDRGVAHLPPNLTDLDLDSSGLITKASFAAFPKTLKRLQLRAAARQVKSHDEALTHLKHVIYRNF